MEKIEFYQRTAAVIENYRKYFYRHKFFHKNFSNECHKISKDRG